MNDAETLAKRRHLSWPNYFSFSFCARSTPPMIPAGPAFSHVVSAQMSFAFGVVVYYPPQPVVVLPWAVLHTTFRRWGGSDRGYFLSFCTRGSSRGPCLGTLVDELVWSAMCV